LNFKSMKIFSDSQVVNMREEQPSIRAALVARCRSVTRGWLAASVFLLSVCCLLIALAALQVLFIGGMDTLGVAPQVSFLCLSIALMALFSLLAFPSMRLNLRRARRQSSTPSEAAKTNSIISGVITSEPTRAVCKVLVIKRLAKDAQAERREAWQNFDGRSKRLEVTLDA